MLRFSTEFSAVLVLAVLALPGAEGEPASPLPPGAIACLTDPEWRQERVASLAFSRDGETLASLGPQGRIFLWKARTGELDRLIGNKYGGCALAFSPDGKILASGGSGGVFLWRFDTGECVGRLKKEVVGPHALAFSPDGTMLAVGGADGVVILWEVKAPGELWRLPPSAASVLAVAFAADGKTVVALGPLHAIHRWDVATGRTIRQGEGQWEKVGGSLTLSPDGRTLAFAGSEGISLWDVETGRELHHFAQSAGFGGDLAFAPDGRMLASGGEDHIIHLWETASGREVRQFSGHPAGIIAFAPDGRTIASTHHHFIMTWDRTGLSEGKPRGRAARAELDGLWETLAGEDAGAADRAVWRMIDGHQTVPFLKERLRPVAAVSRRRLARLIADLSADEYAVREKATRDLEALDDLAVPALDEAMRGRPDLEVRRRVEGLLEKMARGGSPARLRQIRAVAVLEQIGTPEARQVLQALAKGTPEARLTQEARGSLERLAGSKGR